MDKHVEIIPDAAMEVIETLHQGSQEPVLPGQYHVGMEERGYTREQATKHLWTAIALGRVAFTSNYRLLPQK